MTTHSSALSQTQFNEATNQLNKQSNDNSQLYSFSGNKGLNIEEGLLFEVGNLEKSGVDLPMCELQSTSALNGMKRAEAPALPGLSEPEAMRHYVRLSKLNYAIDMGIYPLGSCTMKHNPRLNEKTARFEGFALSHPLQPLSSVSGNLKLIDNLSDILVEITGMDGIALSPKAGAHGEFCGMMAIKAAIKDKGEEKTRTKVLVPESAHGTNPATAASLGFDIIEIKATKNGTLQKSDIIPYIDETVAAIMVTNPNTCGLFEDEIIEIAEVLHQNGGYFYGDGANFNALMGRVNIASLGVDAMHINLHKTFSTPHGGGGPGSGPVVFSERLSKYIPYPFLLKNKSGDLNLIENEEDLKTASEDLGLENVAALGIKPFGRLTAFQGQFTTFVRALTYALSHGADGLKRASTDAVINANYIKAQLEDVLDVAYSGRPTMHEILFTEKTLIEHGVSTLDFAKALIDEGYHPMTMYFPLIVKGAILMEPTETESKQSLDQFIMSVRDIVLRIKRGEVEAIKSAPHFAPRARLDETLAARQPKLRY